jgi:hypothetical protein
MPVLAVRSVSALYVSSKETAKKRRNLAADGRCVITTDAGDLHLIGTEPYPTIHLKANSRYSRKAI